MLPMLIYTNSKKVLFYVQNGKLYSKEKFSQPKQITDSEIISFDGVCSKTGEIHIAASTKDSSVLYIRCTDKETITETLMVSRGHTDAIKKINIFEISGRVSVIYTLEYDEKTMLVYQAYDGSKSYSPEVIDCIKNAGAFCSAADIDGNIHIIYSNDEEVNKYKIYKWSQKAFEDSECGITDEFLKISAVFDDNDMHIVYTTDSGNYVILCYTDDLKKEEQKIGFGMRRDTLVSVWAYNKKTNALWVEGKTVYSCHSDMGSQFTTPMQSVVLGRNKIWCRIRSALNPHKLYFDCAAADIETFSAINMPQAETVRPEQVKAYADGERVAQYSKQQMLSALGSGELLKRLDAIELRLDGLMDCLSAFLNREE